jgi:SLT domain-containing protein
MYDSVKSGISNIYQAFKNWLSDMWNNVFGKFFDWINSAINKLKDFFGLNSKAQNTDISYATTDGSTGTVTMGHALGGIFNREHIARIAEGNKAEAIIPLENQTAMKPFADAVANGVAAALLPVISSMNNREQVQPIYVGTLIADDRGLKELERRLQIIRLSENSRRDS